MTSRLRTGIQTAPLEVGPLMTEVEDAGAGAVLSFVGTVRDHKQGRRVLHIDYEAYSAMAAKVLAALAGDIAQRWPVRALTIVHRTGRVHVGEASVVIALSVAHRAEGFEALRYAIEALKKDAPIWKREFFEDGAVWVQEGS